MCLPIPCYHLIFCLLYHTSTSTYPGLVMNHVGSGRMLADLWGHAAGPVSALGSHGRACSFRCSGGPQRSYMGHTGRVKRGFMACHARLLGRRGFRLVKRGVATNSIVPFK